MVEHPIVLSFKQILQEFDQITVPVTLVCAGNRRKEQNQVRKSNGFSWGAAGVSTAIFTGPLMSEIIFRAKPLRRARYVCMEGADKLVWRRAYSCMSAVKSSAAQRILRDFCKAELGHGPKQRYYARPQDEWRTPSPRSRPSFKSYRPRTNWRKKRQVVDEIDSH
jgi:DMSO/TMAO reductase YedYZ molybdopterin-dependent catalytic subunit